jgi:hypothetical protein
MRIKTLGPVAVATWTVAVATPALAAPPPNDNFADAQRVAIGEEYSGSLTEATAELGEPQYEGMNASHSVWFRYRAPRTGPLTIDTGGSVGQTVLAVFTGGKLSNLHEVGSSAFTSPTGNGAVVRFKGRRHRTYRIVIDTYYDSPKSYKLWLSDGGVKGKGVAMSVDPGQTVDSVRSHGLRVNVSARRRVGAALSLRVSRRTAHRLGLESSVLGRASGPVDYGQSLHGVISLTSAARHALDGVGHLRARLRLTLRGSKAPDKTLTLPVRL